MDEGPRFEGSGFSLFCGGTWGGGGGVLRALGSGLGQGLCSRDRASPAKSL